MNDVEFRMEIDTSNAGMRTTDDVAAALEKVAAKIRGGQDEGKVMDVNGNTVGKWSLALPEGEE